MLDAIGEAPVSAVSGTGFVDADTALKQLRETSREVQAKVWSWNSDYSWPLTPVSGVITLPTNVISVDPTDPTIDAVFREGKLWDRQNRTFTWTLPVLCDVAWLFNFVDIPEPARQYITVRACRTFQARRIGSDTQERYNRLDEGRALGVLQDAEAKAGDFSLRNGSPASVQGGDKAGHGIVGAVLTRAVQNPSTV